MAPRSAARLFVVQGHRGARGLHPENTIAGFAAAIALGVDALELDVALTADDVAVVVHDPILNPDMTRDPSGAWLTPPGPAVRALTLAELRRHDVGRPRPGSRIASAFPDQVPRDGACVPTLAEVMKLAADAGVPIEAELKTEPAHPALTAAPAALADAVVAAAEAAGAMSLLRVRSFDWRGLDHLAATRPDVPLAWLTDAETAADPALWWNRAATGQSTAAAVAAAWTQTADWLPVWAPDHAGLTGEAIAAAHALGLRVIPWTVNNPSRIVMLWQAGADGVCTDRPDLALAAVRRAAPATWRAP